MTPAEEWAYARQVGITNGRWAMLGASSHSLHWTCAFIAGAGQVDG